MQSPQLINICIIGDFKMVKRYLGYHATDKNSAESIIRTKRYNFSNDDEDWLGKGVYFFENNITHALYWCTKYKCFPVWSILESHIEGDKIIDLDDPDTFEEFYKTYMEIKDRYKKRRDGRPRKILDAVVLDIMHIKKPYDLVRGIFRGVPGYDLRNRSFERVRVFPHHIQLCVKNRDCIKSIEEVQTNGH